MYCHDDVYTYFVLYISTLYWLHKQPCFQYATYHFAQTCVSPGSCWWELDLLAGVVPCQTSWVGVCRETSTGNGTHVMQLFCFWSSDKKLLLSCTSWQAVFSRLRYPYTRFSNTSTVLSTSLQTKCLLFQTNSRMKIFS